MARIKVFIDSGLEVAESFPPELVGRVFEGEGGDADSALAALPEDLRGFGAQAVTEASRSADFDGLVDRPSSGWWASAVL